MKDIRIFILIVLLGSLLPVRAELLPYPLDTINGEVLYRYTAEKSIGLYRISVNFGCSQADIIAHNPQLKERGLHVDEVLYIPVAAEDLVAEATVKSADAPVIEPKAPGYGADAPGYSANAPVNITSDSITSEAITSEAITSEALKLALLLPLQAKALERNPQMDRFIDFYEGALLAIYEVQEQGVTIDLKVIDTNKSATHTAAVLASGELNDRQAVIGPAYPAVVNQVTTWANEQHIPVVIPFTNRIDHLEESPYLIQFNATPAIEADSVVAYIRRDSMHVILVEGKDADIPETTRLIRRAVIDSGIDHRITTIRTILSDSLSTVIEPGRKNLLILNTEKFQNINILLPAIERAAKSNNLRLLSQYSWPKEKIDLPTVHTSVFTTDMPVDPSRYDSLYRTFFQHEHASMRPRYDLLGYDLMHATLARLMGTKYEGLQSTIRLEQIGEQGGWRNTYIRMIEE